MNLRPGRLVAALIVAGWAGMLGTHFWHSYAPRAEAALVDLSAPIGAEITQRGVFYRGARIGYIREKITPLDNGVRAEQEGQFTLNVLGHERVMDIDGTATLGENGQLAAFTFRLTTSSGRSPFETEVRGRVIGEEELELVILSGGRERTERRPLQAPIVLPINLYHSLASQELEVGQTYRLHLFDPITLTEGEIEISVLEREIVQWGEREEDALRLRSTFAGLTTMAWVNEAGEVLKEETALGWTLIRRFPAAHFKQDPRETPPTSSPARRFPLLGFPASPKPSPGRASDSTTFPSSGRVCEVDASNSPAKRSSSRSSPFPSSAPVSSVRSNAGRHSAPMLSFKPTTRRSAVPPVAFPRDLPLSRPPVPWSVGFTITFAKPPPSRFPAPEKYSSKERVTATSTRCCSPPWPVPPAYQRGW